jgi:hypothetical protein
MQAEGWHQRLRPDMHLRVDDLHGVSRWLVRAFEDHHAQAAEKQQPRPEVCV